MPLVQGKLIEETFSPAEENGIAARLTDAMVSIQEPNRPCWAWADIVDLLSEEWVIGGPARATGALGARVANE